MNMPLPLSRSAHICMFPLSPTCSEILYSLSRDPWGSSPGRGLLRRKWQPTQIFLGAWEPMDRGSWGASRPQGHKELGHSLAIDYLVSTSATDHTLSTRLCFQSIPSRVVSIFSFIFVSHHKEWWHIRSTLAKFFRFISYHLLIFHCKHCNAWNIRWQLFIINCIHSAGSYNQ